MEMIARRLFIDASEIGSFLTGVLIFDSMSFDQCQVGNSVLFTKTLFPSLDVGKSAIALFTHRDEVV